MSTRVVVAGTDTNIGKTVFAAALVQALDGYYWKPVQAGLEGETDSQAVRRLSGLKASRILLETYRLRTAASPHVAAENDDIHIERGQLRPHLFPSPLVIELAGGLAVPLTRKLLQIDLVAEWKLPVILCASTKLGTINHSLLSIEALKRRAIPILGIAFIGDEIIDTERTVAAFGALKHLGRLPWLDPLDGTTLRNAFAANFSVADILGVGATGP
jgi:dethiobiotin synthetase